MICITGIPATGKTKVCELLRKRGIECAEANEFAAISGCLNDGEVDIECLKNYLKSTAFDGVISSHYSHLLGCEKVIILYADEKDLRERMEKRGYPAEKINENIDAQDSDVIYYEALDLMPENRIIRIKTGNIDETLEKVMNSIMAERKR